MVLPQRMDPRSLVMRFFVALAVCGAVPASAQEEDAGTPSVAVEPVAPVKPTPVVELIGPGLNLRFGEYVTLKAQGVIAPRYTFNQRTQPPAGDPEINQAPSLSRTRVILTLGLTEHVMMRIRFGYATGGPLRVEQAFADFVLPGWGSLRAGQFFSPVSWADSYFPETLVATDFSSAANTFSGGQTHGVMATLTRVDRLKLIALLSDGLRTGYTEFASPVSADVAGMLRVEVMTIGKGFERFDDPGSFRTEPVALRLSAAVHGQTGGATGSTTAKNVLLSTVDAALEGHGFAVTAEGMYAHVSSPAMAAVDDFGVLAEGSVFLLDWLQLWARFDAVWSGGVHSDPFPSPGTGPFRTYGAGANAYLIPGTHHLKVQLDLTLMPDAQSVSLVTTSLNAGVFSTSAGRQWTGRLQLIAAF